MALLTFAESSFCSSPPKVKVKAKGSCGLGLFSERRCWGLRRRLIFSCRVQEEDKGKNGEEPPESLFMKELKKRGMTPTSILEERSKSNNTFEVDQEMDLNEENRGFSKKKVLSTNFENPPLNQREVSMALNSEGLEGLIPRAKLLLTLGGTFFLGFWPLILISTGFFLGLYFYFGPTFVHDASIRSSSLPSYIDPYVLLEEDRLKQIPFRK